MKKPRPNRIAEQRKLKGISQQQLADALEVHWTTISKLERGVTHLNFDYAEEIAQVLGVDVYDLLPERTPLVNISISGFVNHGGDVEEVDDDSTLVITVMSSSFYDTETLWLYVKENALYPYFRDGDILGVTWANDDERRDADGNIDFSEFYGRFCLVESNDGNMFIGIVSQSSSKHMIDLHNANFPPLKNIEPRSLGQVTVSLMLTPAMRNGIISAPASR